MSERIEIIEQLHGGLSLCSTEMLERRIYNGIIYIETYQEIYIRVQPGLYKMDTLVSVYW